MGTNGGQKVQAQIEEDNDESEPLQHIAHVFAILQSIKKVGQMISLTAMALSIPAVCNHSSWWGYLLAGGLGLGIGSA